MNVSLDLTKAQLSKLRNGHGIRITPAVVGSGVDLIIDPMTYNNMAKKLDKGKGVIIKMSSNELDMNKMEGSGLFAGMGNKSGKISRFKKANRWRDFSKDTVNIGMDLGDRALEMYNKQKERPMEKAKESASQLAGLFGNGTKSGKINRLKKGTRWRDFSADTVNIGMDLGDRALEMYNKQKERPMEKAKESTSQLAGLFGKGLKVSGNGLRVRGDGLDVRGGMCCGCGMMNDKFIFADQAL